MRYKGHILIGIIVTYITLYFLQSFLGFDTAFYLSVLPVVIVWSLLPDVDGGIQGMPFIKKAVVSTLLIFAVYFVIRGNYWATFTIILSIIYILFMRHRGGLFERGAHSVLVGIILSAPLYFYGGLSYAVAGFIAFMSHLIADFIHSNYIDKRYGWRWRWI